MAVDLKVKGDVYFREAFGVTGMRKELAGEDDGDRNDNSLRGKSLARALEKEVPKTLTPYEWQEWYAVHGVPSTHRIGKSNKVRRRRGWFSRIFTGGRSDPR